MDTISPGDCYLFACWSPHRSDWFCFDQESVWWTFKITNHVLLWIWHKLTTQTIKFFLKQIIFCHFTSCLFPSIPITWPITSCTPVPIGPAVNIPVHSHLPFTTLSVVLQSILFYSPHQLPIFGHCQSLRRRWPSLICCPLLSFMSRSLVTDLCQSVACHWSSSVCQLLSACWPSSNYSYFWWLSVCWLLSLISLSPFFSLSDFGDLRWPVHWSVVCQCQSVACRRLSSVGDAMMPVCWEFHFLLGWVVMG